MKKIIRHKKLMAIILAMCMILPLISNQYLIVKAENVNATPIAEANITELSLGSQVDLSTLEKQNVSYTSSNGEMSQECTDTHYWLKVNVPENATYIIANLYTMESFCSTTVYRYNEETGALNGSDGYISLKEAGDIFTLNSGLYYINFYSETPVQTTLSLKEQDSGEPDPEEPKQLPDLESEAIEITEDRTSVDMTKLQTIRVYPQDSYDEEGNPIEYFDDRGILYKYKIPAQTETEISLEGTGENDDNASMRVYKELNNGLGEYVNDVYAIKNYSTSDSAQWTYIWVSTYEDAGSFTIVKNEVPTDAYDFTTPYDEAVKALYDAGNLQDVYLYSYNDEAYSIMETFYGSHPEYVDKVHFVNMNTGDGDAYTDEVNKKLAENASVIGTFDTDWVKDNKINYANVISVSKLGGTGSDGKTLEDYYKENSYACSQSYATYDGELKYVAPYVCPGMFMYNKDIAKAVLGTDDPEEVKAHISDWDSFMETAEAAKAKGYYMTSGSEDVVAGMCGQPETYNAMVVAGYETGHATWSDEWNEEISNNNTIFGFFATTWFGWSFDENELSKYDFCAAPVSYLWGGTYFAANNACESNPLAAQLLYLMTCDTEAMTTYGTNNMNLVNNQVAFAAIAGKTVEHIYTGVSSWESLCNRWDQYAKQAGTDSANIDKLSTKQAGAIELTGNEYIANAESVDTVKIPVGVSKYGYVKYEKSSGKLYSLTLPAKNVVHITDRKTIDDGETTDMVYVYCDGGLDAEPIFYDCGGAVFSNLGNEPKTYYLWVAGDNSGITIHKDVTSMDKTENDTDAGKKVDTTVDTTDKGSSIIVSENKDQTEVVQNAAVKVSVTDAADSDEAIQKGIDVIMQYNSDNEGKAQVDRIEVSYSGDESVTVSANTINSLKNLQGNVSLEVSKKSGEDADKTVYTWKFKPESIETVEAVNTKINIYENAIGYENKTVVDNLTDKTATKCVLAFEHNGVLPENTEVTVGVADQYTDGTELYYYHIDVVNNKLEEIGTTVVENGCATLKLSHCSDYVMSNKPVCQHSNTGIRGQKSASCIAEGYTGDKYCKDCGIQLSTGTTIPKTAHVAGQWIIDKEATVDAEGSMHTECTVCKTVLDTKKIDKLPAPAPTTDATVTASGVYVASHTKDTIVVGLVAEPSKTADLEYRWLVCDTSVDSNAWTEIQGWTKNNEWLTWKPGKTGDYVIVGQVRVVGNEESQSQASVGIPHHAQIKGKCQMPYTGEGGGYLIGIESYDNPNQEYTYELLVLDCTLLAEGKDAWVWTTGRCKVPETSFWAVWQPQYGYYWTLFRVYDKDGNLIDQECYPFVNAY